MEKSRHFNIQQGALENLFNDAVTAHNNGAFQEAEQIYRTILAQSPNHLPSLINLAIILKNKGFYHSAIALYKRALTLKPDSVSLKGNLGNALLLIGEAEQALRLHEEVSAALPEDPAAFFNKGLALRACGNLEQAIFCFDRALAIKDSYLEAEWDRALTLLMSGNYQEGFSAYETRWKLPTVEKPKFTHPAWTGGDPNGKIILVYAEQGFGDTLHFVRYLKILKAKGATVLFQCQRELEPLLKQQPYIDAVIPQGNDLPEFDCHAALLTLPHYLGTTARNIPNETPYISLSSTKDSSAPPAWLPASEENILKIGIVWAGKSTHSNDHHRSCGLLPFLRLLECPRVSLYSLQVGERSHDIAALQVHDIIQNLSPHIRNFADTAAIIQHLDVVVTVDTAVAHLAGAMGVPTFTVLPRIGDWRWGYTSPTTPWYPSMQLFRQSKANQWHDVFDVVAETLNAFDSA